MGFMELLKSSNPENLFLDPANPQQLIKLFDKYLFSELRSKADSIKDDPNIVNKEEAIAGVVYEGVCKRIRELMRIDNFSILCGAGSSYDVGGVTFGSTELEEAGWVGQHFHDHDLSEVFSSLRNKYKTMRPGLNWGIEDFLTYLYRLGFITNCGYKEDANFPDSLLKAEDVRQEILKVLRAKCDLPIRGKENKIDTYKTFLRRIISRPVNLRRTNLFTTNYDLVFEKAMDEMSLIYVDGFIGGLKRFFHSEAFGFDYYYPAGTTEGKVSRMEKVLQFFKLHGSLNWIDASEDNPINVFGIEKVPYAPDLEGNFLIYPSPLKEQDTIGFPYSEMFRRFANAIQQPQSVLITYGYSFSDLHINRIIFEALSIPSFHLLVVSYSWTENIKKLYEQFKNEPSVGFIIGKDVANWETFVTKFLPDLPTIELEEKYQSKRSAARSIRDVTLRMDGGDHV